MKPGEVVKHLLSLLFWIALGLFASQGLAFAQPSEKLNVAIVSVEGDVEVKFPDQGWVPAKPGMKLQEGVELRTGPFSTANLIFADNSIASVDSFTQLTIDSFVKTDTTIKTHINLTVGSMTSTVNRGELINDYEIVTPTVTASVRGTQIKRITSGALYGDSIEMGDHGKLEFFDDIGLLHALLGGESSGSELAPDAPEGGADATSVADGSLGDTNNLLSAPGQETTDSSTETVALADAPLSTTDTGTLSTEGSAFTETATASSDPYQGTTDTGTLSTTEDSTFTETTVASSDPDQSITDSGTQTVALTDTSLSTTDTAALASTDSTETEETEDEDTDTLSTESSTSTETTVASSDSDQETTDSSTETVASTDSTETEETEEEDTYTLSTESSTSTETTVASS
ncbi:MAG: hypothetical protein ACE5KK_03595, partial [Candidatus Brocadiales bacterium]